MILIEKRSGKTKTMVNYWEGRSAGGWEINDKFTKSMYSSMALVIKDFFKSNKVYLCFIVTKIKYFLGFSTCLQCLTYRKYPINFPINGYWMNKWIKPIQNVWRWVKPLELNQLYE